MVIFTVDLGLVQEGPALALMPVLARERVRVTGEVGTGCFGSAGAVLDSCIAGMATGAGMGRETAPGIAD